MVSDGLLGVALVVGLVVVAGAVRLLDPFVEPGTDEQPPVDEWYEETASIADEIEGTWQAEYAEPRRDGHTPMYDEVKAELDRLATALDEQIREADDYDVDAHVFRLAAETIAKCRHVAGLSLFLATREEFEQRGREAASAAVDLESEIRMAR